MADEIVWKILNRDLFFVRNAVKASEAKMSDKFDVVDPETRETLLECREPDISGFVKLARLFGGRHDYGSPFNLVARHPTSGQQVFRVARGSTSFSFGGVKMDFRDHRDAELGKMKKLTFALGLKFSFSKDEGRELYQLQVKSHPLSSDFELFLNELKVAQLDAKWTGAHVDFYKEGKFSFAFSLMPDLPHNDVRRQLLLAFATVSHRVNA